MGSGSKEEWGVGRGRSHGVDGECCNGEEAGGERPDNKRDEGDRGKIEEARGGMGDEERRFEGAGIDGG